jgi:hypothetical protein
VQRLCSLFDIAFHAPGWAWRAIATRNQSLADKKSKDRPSVISARTGRLSGMLTQAPVQRRTRPYAQGMGTYSDKPRSVTAAGSYLSRLEEEIDASSRPAAGRRKLSKNPLAA